MLRDSLILVKRREEATTEVKEKLAEQIERVGNLTYEIDFVVSLQASLPNVMESLQALIPAS